MSILSSQTRFDDIEINGVVELVGSSPAYGDGFLGVTGEVYNRRSTGTSNICPLGNLIGGFALIFGGKCLHNHTIIGVGS